MELHFVWGEKDKAYFLRNSRTGKWLGTKLFKGFTIAENTSYWYITSSNELDPHWWTKDIDPTMNVPRSTRIRFATADDAKAYAIFIIESLGELE